jgi:hypothetical protein
MKLSGWARLWIVASAILAAPGCDFVYRSDAVSSTVIVDVGSACDEFLRHVRRDWELRPDEAAQEREWAAIDRMRKACVELQDEMAAKQPGKSE